MKCPKCGSERVNVNTSVVAKSKHRSFLWNLFMICITCGLWIIWMLVRKRKEKIVQITTATCQECAHTWKM